MGTRPGIPVMDAVISQAEEARYAELQHMALDFARHGETGSLETMLGHGLPVNLADGKGNSLLLLATYHGHVETSAMLLRHHAEVDRRNDRGQTPLGGAAFKGHCAILTLLLDAGAEIDADTGGGMTALMFAAMFGRTDAVSLLRERHASLERRNRLGLSARWIMAGANLWWRPARWLGRRRKASPVPSAR